VTRILLASASPARLAVLRGAPDVAVDLIARGLIRTWSGTFRHYPV